MTTRLHYWSYRVPCRRDFATREEAEEFGYALTEETWDTPYGEGLPKELVEGGVVVSVYTWDRGWVDPPEEYVPLGVRRVEEA